jgi:hypothetical protein
MPSYGPPNNTDRWQPIDAGYGKLVKDKTKEYYQAWWNQYAYYFITFLIFIRNRIKYATKTIPASERRILMTQWVGQAVQEIGATVHINKYFEKTGCLITAMGKYDDSIFINRLFPNI